MSEELVTCTRATWKKATVFFGPFRVRFPRLACRKVQEGTDNGKPFRARGERNFRFGFAEEVSDEADEESPCDETSIRKERHEGGK